MAMEIKGFIRQNSFLRFIDLAIGWEAASHSAFHEPPGRLLVSDVRNDGSGELRGISLVRCADNYRLVDSIMNLNIGQARELHEALSLLLEDDTTKAADDGKV